MTIKTQLTNFYTVFTTTLGSTGLIFFHHTIGLKNFPREIWIKQIHNP